MELNVEKKKTIFNQLKKLALILEPSINPERLQIYTELLSQFPIEKIEGALGWCMLNCNRFPVPAQIIARIQPPKQEERPIDQAQELSGSILEAARRFGRYQYEEAIKFLGPIAIAVINRFGGWNNICEMEMTDYTARAQLREQCLSVLIAKDRDPMKDLYPYQKQTTALLSEHNRNIKLLNSD